MRQKRSKHFIATSCSRVIPFAWCSLAMGIVINLASCDTQSEITEDSQTASKLRVTTRDGDSEGTVAQGKIYVFNSSGTCINSANTNSTNPTAAIGLSSGRYSICAVGSNDLSNYSLPTAASASMSAVISVAEGKNLGDLMMKKQDIIVGEGETLPITLSLDRKVLCLDAVEIKEVPDDVTKIEVEISPIYSAIQLDGTFSADIATETYKIALTEQSDGTTWKSSPQKMLFPSKGKPTVRMSFTKGTQTRGYCYTAPETLQANHHYTISGTYQSTEQSTVNAVLTARDWEENRDFTFNFDRFSNTCDTPEAQKFYNGYYVVKVDDATGNAVLLSKKEVSFTIPSSSDNSAWLSAINTALASITEKPAGATGSWRLPTPEEAELFIQDSQIVTQHAVTNSGVTTVMTASFYCLNNSVLNWIYLKFDSDPYTPHSGSSGFNTTVILRPVIDL